MKASLASIILSAILIGVAAANTKTEYKEIKFTLRNLTEGSEGRNSTQEWCKNITNDECSYDQTECFSEFRRALKGELSSLYNTSKPVRVANNFTFHGLEGQIACANETGDGKFRLSLTNKSDVDAVLAILTVPIEENQSVPVPEPSAEDKKNADTGKSADKADGAVPAPTVPVPANNNTNGSAPEPIGQPQAPEGKTEDADSHLSWSIPLIIILLLVVAGAVFYIFRYLNRAEYRTTSMTKASGQSDSEKPATTTTTDAKV